jgi:hypothetical protein
VDCNLRGHAGDSNAEHAVADRYARRRACEVARFTRARRDGACYTSSNLRIHPVSNQVLDVVHPRLAAVTRIGCAV